LKSAQKHPVAEGEETEILLDRLLIKRGNGSFFTAKKNEAVREKTS